jgi:hypothetical protein
MSLFAHQDRNALRASWREAWQRRCTGLPLQPLQAQIADVVSEHPEYQQWLASEAALQSDFSPEGGRENPFLHMSLHLAIQEQVATDRPRGIAPLYHRLVASAGSAHAAEHRMLEVLATEIWDAQRAGRAPDEAAYLQRLRSL